MEQRDGGVEIPLRTISLDIALPELQASRGARAARVGAADHVRAEIDAGDGPSLTREFHGVHAGAAAEIEQGAGPSAMAAQLLIDEGCFRNIILVLIQQVVPGRILLESGHARISLRASAERTI